VTLEFRIFLGAWFLYQLIEANFGMFSAGTCPRTLSLATLIDHAVVSEPAQRLRRGRRSLAPEPADP
jgi:hypothetical protein